MKKHLKKHRTTTGMASLFAEKKRPAQPRPNGRSLLGSDRLKVQDYQRFGLKTDGGTVAQRKSRFGEGKEAQNLFFRMFFFFLRKRKKSCSLLVLAIFFEAKSDEN